MRVADNRTDKASHMGDVAVQCEHYILEIGVYI